MKFNIYSFVTEYVMPHDCLLCTLNKRYDPRSTFHSSHAHFHQMTVYKLNYMNVLTLYVELLIASIAFINKFTKIELMKKAFLELQNKSPLNKLEIHE